MTMHFRIRFNKSNVKLSNVTVQKLRNNIKSYKLNLNDAVDDFTNPLGTANGGADINKANKAGLNIINTLGVIYNFSSSNFINHMFCSYETDGPVVSYKDVNFADPDFGPIPCNPDNWNRVLNGLVTRLSKRIATRPFAYSYQRSI